MLRLGLGMAGGARGWVAGRAGFWGALFCYLGLGSAAPAPRFLGTQPPHAMQVLTCKYITAALIIIHVSHTCISSYSLRRYKNEGD